jgi:two-component system, NtrC family, response regulator HydG
MSKLHLLVVDDDRDFAESLADVLRSDGHWVDTVYSGEEAIARFPQRRYDLTFMDVKLPGRNGVESLLELRKLQPDAQVYMMTGFSMEHLVERALSEGARGVLHKPLDLDRVLLMLKELQSCQILIADDDPDFVAAIQDVLEDGGYAVVVARDGGEAVARVQAGGIDVLILDLRMPILSGLEVCQQLHRSGIMPPTIIVTAYSRAETATLQTLRAMAPAGILFKPFDPAELLAVVARTTGR